MRHNFFIYFLLAVFCCFGVEAKIFGDTCHNNKHIIYYNAQTHLSTANIVWFVKKKYAICGYDSISPHVDVFVWDCKQKIRSVDWYWHSQEEKQNVLHQCQKHVKHIRLAMQELQRVLHEHRRLKPQIQQIVGWSQDTTRTYNNNLYNIKHEQSVLNNLQQLNELFAVFSNHYDEFQKFFKQVLKHLSNDLNYVGTKDNIKAKNLILLIKNQIKDIEVHAEFSVYKDILPSMKKLLQSIEFLSSSQDENHKLLLAQIMTLLQYNYKSSDKGYFKSFLNLISKMQTDSTNRLQGLKNFEKSTLTNYQQQTHTISTLQNDWLKMWSLFVGVNYTKEHLSFIESIPDFSLSFDIKKWSSKIKN